MGPQAETLYLPRCCNSVGTASVDLDGLRHDASARPARPSPIHGPPSPTRWGGLHRRQQQGNVPSSVTRLANQIYSIHQYYPSAYDALCRHSAGAQFPCEPLFHATRWWWWNKCHHLTLSGHTGMPTFEKISCMRESTPSRNSACKPQQMRAQQWSGGEDPILCELRLLCHVPCDVASTC